MNDDSRTGSLLLGSLLYLIVAGALVTSAIMGLGMLDLSPFWGILPALILGGGVTLFLPPVIAALPLLTLAMVGLGGVLYLWPVPLPAAVGIAIAFVTPGEMRVVLGLASKSRGSDAQRNE